jgi:hypothetical protein
MRIQFPFGDLSIIVLCMVFIMSGKKVLWRNRLEPNDKLKLMLIEIG